MDPLHVSVHLPEEVSVVYDELLYNTPSWLEANNDLPQVHFYLIDEARGQALGHMACTLNEKEAYSPFNAPFGGFELSRPVDSSVFLYFAGEVLRRLEKKEVEHLRIKQWPGQGLGFSIIEALDRLGFSRMDEQAHHWIAVDKHPLWQQMQPMERRRLKKCRHEAFRFERLPASGLSEVYDFIKRCREQKSYGFSMSWPALKAASEAVPGAYLPAGVYDGEKLVAATIAVRASSGILYNYAPAHRPDYRNYSPVVMLVDGLYTWAQQHGFTAIDLGTSYVEGEVNRSLVRFKERMGGRTNSACILGKTLNSS